MKKFLLLIFALISLNAFSQISVKEGSFRKIEGYVMLDKNKHLDDNDNPMALIKITTENISAEERAKFYFNGNLETYFDKQLQEDGQLYLYISAVAPFMEIIHPEYGKTEYTFPFDLCGYCGYEMVVQYVESKQELGFLAISSEPTDADIYIDGKHYGETPNYISDILIGKHELKLTKQGCAPITKTINIKEGEALTINEKLQTGKEISISTDQSGDKIYVDGIYVGVFPLTTNLSYGSHEIKAEREGKTVSKTINVAQSVGEANIKLAFFGNQTFTVKGVTFTMIAVEGGTFKMGATSEQGSDAYENAKPVHSVTLSDYYIGETEVTQELWIAVMGSNPSYFKGSMKPVEIVSWNDCQTFIKKLNQLTGKNFRLPTEAEWEYAARGGNKSQGYKYSGSNTIGNVAWYDVNSGDKTHDVKTKQANELGIYDMSGNVWEWCQDGYGSYSSGSQTNPIGPSSGSRCVGRGGSWYDDAEYCRVSFRGYYIPYDSNDGLGLRLSLSQ